MDNILNETEMQKLNALALFEKKSHQEIARNFLVEKKLIQNKTIVAQSDAENILLHALDHLKLTLISLLAAMLFALPLGILLYRFKNYPNPFCILRAFYKPFLPLLCSL